MSDVAININSKPNLDEWGWDDFWDAEDWMCWYYILKSAKGKSYADTEFLKYWNMQSFGASTLDARSFDENFRSFAKKENILDALYGNATFLKPFGAVTDVVSLGSDTVSSAAKGAKNTANVLKWALPILLIVILSGGVYWGYTKFFKTA